MTSLLPIVVKWATLVVIGDVFLLADDLPTRYQYITNDLAAAAACYEVKWVALNRPITLVEHLFV